MALFAAIRSLSLNVTRVFSPFTNSRLCTLYSVINPVHRNPIMPSIKLQPHCPNLGEVIANASTPNNPLPALLQTPSGLALLEIQGTINLPSVNEDDYDMIDSTKNVDPASVFETPIGKLMFPEYSVHNPDDTTWMKRAYLYVGRYQRMTGEVKKLPRPLAVLQKCRDSENEELEVVEIVRYKIFFKNRPEPVNNV